MTHLLTDSVTTQELSFPLSHLTLRGLRFGDPDKPLMLALHGWLDNAASFAPLAQYLSDYQIVALDFTGHGKSEHRSPDAHYHLIDFVHDLRELVLSQGWDSFILLGHSMGGVVASLYTASFPESVQRFISIEAFGPLVKEPESAATQLRSSIESRLQIAEKEARHPKSLEQAIQARLGAGPMASRSARLLVERNLEVLNAPDSDIALDPDVDDSLEQALRWRSDRRLRTISSMRFTPEQAKAIMHNIRCPMLVILGDQGFEQMKGFFNERKTWVADLQFRECPGEHHLHMDNPLPTAQAISSFLTQKEC